VGLDIRKRSTLFREKYSIMKRVKSETITAKMRGVDGEESSVYAQSETEILLAAILDELKAIRMRLAGKDEKKKKGKKKCS